jgi:hypothetical protein
MGATSGAIGWGTPRRRASAQTLPKEKTKARAAMTAMTTVTVRRVNGSSVMCGASFRGAGRG